MASLPVPADNLLPSPAGVHAWNKDRSSIAVSPNNQEIYIYKTNKSEDVSKWEVTDVLCNHDHFVTAIDWAPNSNKILSCSHDRNAYVWCYEVVDEKNMILEWKPTLVLLRTNRAATCCKWSPDESKFAVGTGSKEVCICYFEHENNWWVSKSIKKGIKSTVTCVSWYPNDNTLLVVGACDFKCRVYSAYIKQIDKKEAKRAELGELVAEYPSMGWILDASYSPSGKTIAFIGHDSCITFVDATTNTVEATVKFSGLPWRSMLFLSENVVVAGGYDYSPFIIAKKNNKWEILGRCDAETEAKQATQSARSVFERATIKSSSAVSVHTKQCAVIASIRAYSGTKDKAAKFTTSGGHRLLFWDVPALAKKMGFDL